MVQSLVITECALIALRNSSSGNAAEKADPPMRKTFDKWFLPVVFVMIGSAMVWAIWRG